MSVPGRKIRVLVADDSRLVRRLIERVLGDDAFIEVCGTAHDGLDAVAKIQSLKPDVVTLDIEMPRMTGLQALKVLQERGIKVPVIMFSTLTEHGGRATIEALTLGAADYLLKPSNGAGGVKETLAKLKQRLVPKIKRLYAATCRRSHVTARGSAHRAAARPRSVVPARHETPSSAPHRLRSAPSPPQNSASQLTARLASAARTRGGGMPGLCVIGSSTGGPAALDKVLRPLPANFPLPIVVVQHMPKMFTRLLAERLDAACHLTVREAQAGMKPTAGTVMIAPGGFHLTLRRDGAGYVLATNSQSPVNHCRPSVDVLFNSVAALKGVNALTVVLTGMGHDGAAGAGAIRDAGGYVIAQDEETSVVWGMPGATVNDGFADDILPLHQIAQAMKHRVVRVQGAHMAAAARRCRAAAGGAR